MQNLFLIRYNLLPVFPLWSEWIRDKCLLVQQLPPIAPSGRSALQHLFESFPEAVVQEGVQEGVEAGVGVAQAGDEVGDPDHQRRGPQVCGQSYDGAQVERGPTEQADGQHNENHDGDLLLGLVQSLGIAVELHVSQFVEHHGVQDADGGHRDSKAQNERVDPAGFKPQRLGAREAQHAAFAVVVWVVDSGEHGERHDDEDDEDPDAEGDDFGRPVGAVRHALGPHRCPDDQVAIDAHHGQEVDAGEDVVMVYAKDDFTQNLPKRPVIQQVFSNADRQHQREQIICDGQVQDEHVGDCFHFGGFEDDIDDSRVARQSHGADHRIDDG